MTERLSLYGEVTSRIIAELEQGRFPWVQPWNASRCPCASDTGGEDGAI
jgi:antirestriction protein ArdC